MMVLNTNEISLINNNNNNIKGSGNSCYVPKTISEFVGEVSMIRNVSERVMKMDGFVKKLEEEMRKIDAFKRELPISVLLINDAITALKEEIVQCRKRRVEPVFEEFIPLKKSREYDGEDEKDEVVKEVDISKDKKNWLSSVQLWNNTDNQSNGSNYSRKSNAIFEINNKKCEEVNRGMTKDLVQSATISTQGKAFMPFKGYSACAVEATRKEDHFEIPVACAVEATRKEDEFEFPVVAPLSLRTPATAISMPGEEFGPSALSSKSSSSKAGSSSPRISPPLSQSQQQTARKQRRCWSPELHRCFVSALQQLGGSQATPKQIRDLMQVDGLTNDEVKSHLQKYRLHTRKSPHIANPSAFPFGRLYNTPQDQDIESSKGKSITKSGSPNSPLRLTETTGGTCNLWVNSMEDADGEVKRSDTNRWKLPFPTAGRVGV